MDGATTDGAIKGVVTPRDGSTGDSATMDGAIMGW